MAQLNNTPETELPSLAERHKSILDILQLQGSVSVSDLAERLEVSEVTIRKDLSALEKQNKLYRTHGRAIPISPYIGDRHINEKEKQFVLEKRAIGKVAASMVNEHDSILMASGTSILYAAKELVEKKNITVISASVSASSLLSQNKDIDVVQLGGIVRESSVSVVGSFAEAMLKYFNCNLLFMGADGVDLEFGGEPEQDDDEHVTADRTPCRQQQVRQEGIHQDLRRGRNRPHHHGRQNPSDLSGKSSGAGH